MHIVKDMGHKRGPEMLVSYEYIRLRPSGELTTKLMTFSMENEAVGGV